MGSMQVKLVVTNAMECRVFELDHFDPTGPPTLSWKLESAESSYRL